jgi:hypothetical protein
MAYSRFGAEKMRREHPIVQARKKVHKDGEKRKRVCQNAMGLEN